MTQTGQANIRGIDIQKVATGYADEENIFKQFLTVTPTSAREIRWYQKTAGFLDSSDTSGITASMIANTAEGSQPVVIQPNWTRMTSYIREYFAESPFISDEDINDSDPDVYTTIVRDTVRGVENQIDIRIYSQMSGSFALSGNAAGTGWGDATNGNPIQDLLSGSRLIRTQRYDTSNLVVFMHPNQTQTLLTYLITTKGSSIPNFSSDLVKSGVLLRLLNFRLVESANCDDKTIVMFVPQRAATWKTFLGIQTAVIDNPLIGKKIRCKEEGEILVTNINAGCTIKGC